jgi:hypothetical protein
MEQQNALVGIDLASEMNEIVIVADQFASALAVFAEAVRELYIGFEKCRE